MSAILWIFSYTVSVVVINYAFSIRPDLDTAWSCWVGLVFLLRDMVQVRVGHWSLLVMVVALSLSYVTSDPFVAVASASAFAASEIIDWIVFTITKRPFPDRLWISASLSVPVDTAMFFGILGVWSSTAWGVALASKLSGVTVVWLIMTVRRRMLVV